MIIFSGNVHKNSFLIYHNKVGQKFGKIISQELQFEFGQYITEFIENLILYTIGDFIAESLQSLLKNLKEFHYDCNIFSRNLSNDYKKALMNFCLKKSEQVFNIVMKRHTLFYLFLKDVFFLV